MYTDAIKATQVYTYTIFLWKIGNSAFVLNMNMMQIKVNVDMSIVLVLLIILDNAIGECIHLLALQQAYHSNQLTAFMLMMMVVL